ncbi:hypothetical protein B7R22_17810 [Subtercola boreus]|uniref:Uncharacterized protein n=1 Tax=Subtercola boreus TaxID=120213 RepID=A0A3E0VSD9_9MICO|nr:hypothetical protein B7R22_17810 [Subtercola boreus]
MLDLTSERDARYAVLVNALADYATTLEHHADDERDREPGSYAEAGFRQDAATARTLMAEIEQQLEA